MTSHTGPESGHLGDLLSALVDGELTMAEQRAAEDHLARCQACQASLEMTARVRQMVAGLPLLEVPAAVRAGMLAGVGRRPRPLVWAGAAAAVVGISVLAAFPSQHRVTPQMTHLVQVHAVTSGADPVTQLAPAAVPVSFGR